MKVISARRKAAVVCVVAIVVCRGRDVVRASDSDWWAFVPPRRSEPPSIEQPERARNSIDRFVLARLDAAREEVRRSVNGPAPSPPADRRTLVRRLSFDLVGLPPSPELIARVLADSSPDAVDRLADELLDSKHFGERWARHWLDVARFGESHGFEYNQPRENAWHYRNWVIDALNADMPYDEFVRLQIAGDVLRPNDPAAIIATGFLVAGPYNTTKPSTGRMRLVMREEELEDVVATIGQTVLGLTVNCARCHDHKFDPISLEEYYRLRAALAGVQHGERQLPGKPEMKVWAVTPVKPEPTHVLARGDPSSPGRVVSAGGVAALRGVSADFGLAENANDADRRLGLAKWLTSSKNPLFARVIVNRLWHHYFGRGLVATPSDFGVNGGAPSHPELLDWLAVELISNGFRLKHIHRLIVTSATYRQSSAPRDEALARDADNRLLWRYTPRRLEAEVLRDACLAVSGDLDPMVGGRGYRDLETTKFGGSFFFDPKRDDESTRRTIYRFSPRGAKRGFLDAFDCADPSAPTPVRAETTTPLQALALMNNAFVLNRAARFAKRLEGLGSTTATRVERAYELAFSRPAAADEVAEASAFVDEHGLAAFCRVLFNANEFLYVH